MYQESDQSPFGENYASMYEFDTSSGNLHRHAAEYLMSNKEPTQRIRIYFRKVFYWFHVICAMALLATLIAIIVYASNGTFNAQVYWTYSPLERDTSVSPPTDFFTNFRIIHLAHLAIPCAFIPFFAFLYYFVLVCPFSVIAGFMTCFGFGKRVTAIENASPIDPEDSAYRNYSKMYLAWYDVNLLTGHAGFKFTFFSISVAFITVVVAHSVGVTDFFILFMIWVFPCFGLLILWHFQYSRSHLIKEAFYHSTQGNDLTRSFFPRDSPPGTTNTVGTDVESGFFVTGENVSPVPSAGSSSMQPGTGPSSGPKTALGAGAAFLKNTEEKINQLVDFLDRSVVSYTPVFLAKLMLLMSFVIIITFFAEMVSADSSAVGSEVYVAVTYYIFMILTIVLIIWLHHVHFIILRNVFIVEFILQTVVVIGCILIPLVLLGSTHDEGILYGVA